MRLLIAEQLEQYNKLNNKQMTLRDIALLAYDDHETIDQTKINRISALNTGRLTASIKDLVAISEVLGCQCTDLIHVP